MAILSGVLDPTQAEPLKLRALAQSETLGLEVSAKPLLQFANDSHTPIFLF